MRVKIKNIEVSISEKEAISIINAIQKGIGEEMYFEKKPENDGAIEFIELLKGNFINGVNYVHYISKRD